MLARSALVFALVSLMAFAPSSARADDEVEPLEADRSDAEAEAGPPQLRAELRNGMVLVGTAPFDELRVLTAYGELTVPTRELVEIRFGLVSAPEMVTQIDAWIEQLMGADDKDARDEARAELVRNGEIALSKLREALKAEDVRSKKGVEKAIADIESAGASEPLLEDHLTAERFGVVGHVQLGRLKIETQFGVMDVPQSALRRLSTARAPRQLKVEVASSHRGMSFFDSGIEVRRGETVEIRATGQVSYTRVQTDRSHRSGGNMAFGPTGNATFGTYQGQYTAGALIMKVGGDGKVETVGDRIRFKADREGKLQFSIALDGDAGTGSYELDVVVSPQ